MEDTRQLLDDCEAREESLTDWERNFIDSIRHQFDKNGSLSERQYEVLEKIWNRIT